MQLQYYTTLGCIIYTIDQTSGSNFQRCGWSIRENSRIEGERKDYNWDLMQNPWREAPFSPCTYGGKTLVTHIKVTASALPVMLQLVVELIFSVAVNGVVVVPGDSILHSVIKSPLHTTLSDNYL